MEVRSCVLGPGVGLCTGNFPQSSLAWLGARVPAKGRGGKQEGRVISATSAAAVGSASVGAMLSQLVHSE